MKPIERAVTKPAPIIEELPEDLARPHEDAAERASYYANLITAGALGVVAAVLFGYGIFLV